MSLVLFPCHPVLRRSTEVKCSVNDLCRFFRVPLLSKVIWGADFNADIHYTLRCLEMRSWKKHSHQRSMTLCDPQIFFEFLTHKNHPRAIKKHRYVSTRREKHAGHQNFALAPSEAKLSAITGFRYFSALDLTPEVTGWPRTFSFYTNRFVSWRATSSFFREVLTQSGAGSSRLDKHLDKRAAIEYT